MESQSNTRLEAFCDAVFAIALTLLILDVRLPPASSIGSTSQLWHELGRLGPSILAFGLSFVVVFITWVNHRVTLRLVNRSTPSFLYANGFLLLTVVCVPFTARMLGEFLDTAYASPAVVVYNAVLAAEALAWILLSGAALKNDLFATEAARTTIRASNRNGFSAFALYSALAIAGFWLPVTAVVITTASWVFWLVFGIRMHEGEVA